MRLPKPILFCLIALPLIAFLLRATRFETRVSIQNDRHLSWSICGAEPIVDELPLQRINQIEVFAEESVFPLTLEDPVLHLPSGTKLLNTPAPYSLQARSAGDWWIDKEYGKPERVYATTTDITGPFRLHAIFTGRSFRPTVIVLRGDRVVMFRFFRGMLNNLYEIMSADGRVLRGSVLRLPAQQSLLNILNTVLHGLFAGCVLVVLFWLLSRLSLKMKLEWRIRHGAVVIPLFLLFFATSVWMAVSVFQAVPHFQDDLNFILRAKWLLHGKLYQEEPAFAQNLRIPTTVFWKDRWLSSYPINWPLLLAVGQSLNIPWIISAFGGCLSLILIYRLGSKLYSERIGTAACVLAALSPMYLLMSASVLTHAASNLLMIAFFYLLVTGWPLVENHAQSRSRLILAGVCAGYVFGMRPLTALVMVAPPLLVAVLDSRNDSNRTFLRLVTLMVGAVLGALPALADNYLITGNPLRFMYSFAQGRWSLVDGLMNTDSMLASMLPTLFGWGWKWPSSWFFLSLPLGLAAVPFLMGKANRWDWLLMATSVSLPVAYAAHSYVGGHGFGARFYYESYFCLFLLAARGFHLLLYPEKDSVARLVATGMFVVLSVWSASTMIDRLHLYRGYNDVTNSLTRAIETAGIQKSIVLLGNNNWRDWNSAGNLIQGSFDDDLIIAWNTSDNSPLLRAYPDRAVYLWLDGKLIRQK